MSELTHHTLCGIRITSCTPDQLHAELLSMREAKAPRVFAHLNVHGFNIAWRQPWYRTFLNQAHLVFCDGFGIRLGAKAFGISLPPRLTYAEWFPPFCDVAAEEGLSLFFFGGQPGVAEEASKRLRDNRPHLKIVGTQHGYLEAGSAEEAAFLEQLRSANPDVLLVGLGMPRQEEWIQAHLTDLPACAVLPAGAALDYLSGTLKRAPTWMTDHGLEWLGRLLIEPRRLWHRYLVGNTLFLLRIFKVRMGGKIP